MGIIINRRRVMGKKLPYDAEIEYLKSSGTQYINTNWIPDLTKNLRIECSAGWVNTNRGMLISAFTNRGQNNLSVELYNQKVLRFYAGGNNVVLSECIGELNVLYPIEITYTASNGLCTMNIDNNTYSGNVSQGGRILNTQSAVLGSDQVHRLPYGMFGEMKVYNPDLVIDFIPVRIGTTGYMYDKVSKQLFGNAGTGEFILGPDVTLGNSWNRKATLWGKEMLYGYTATNKITINSFTTVKRSWRI